MSVNSKMKAIADMIRLYLMTEDKYTLDDMAQGVDDVYYKGDADGYIQGIYVGIEEGIEQGRAEAETEKLSLSMSLSQALYSGEDNIDPLEINIERAKSDIGAIKTLIENRGVEVPIGTPSSTYDETIEQIITDEKTTGIEQGRQAESKEWWDNYLANRNYLMMQQFSGYGWNDKTFKPTKDMNPTDANSMFQYAQITDLQAILDKQGVKLNFYNCSSLYGCFYNSSITHIGEIDISQHSKYSNLNNTFGLCSKLVTIDKIKLSGGYAHNISDDTFKNCTSLQNITFENNIYGSINFQWSPLSKKSITNIIEHLHPTETGKTLTLKKTAKEAAFTDEEWATLAATKPNWTISLV